MLDNDIPALLKLSFFIWTRNFRPDVHQHDYPEMSLTRVESCGVFPIVAVGEIVIFTHNCGQERPESNAQTQVHNTKPHQCHRRSKTSWIDMSSTSSVKMLRCWSKELQLCYKGPACESESGLMIFSIILPVVLSE